ncbi:MAG: rhodanese-like domain-containing protein, partial [Myxococcales bacterium]|nr:rhodanese-like domain-containing protein [Myxococcales bacterium]
VEANPMIAQAFQVQSIPMLVLMQNGQVAGHHLGALDREALRKLVAPIVGAAAGASVRELSTKELSELIKGGAALPVDLREPAAYGRYRIPTALNIPAEEIDTRLAELRPGDGRIRVLYSRSAEPASAVAEKLGSAGLEIGFLAGGFLHWEADGYEVERG